MAGPGDAGPPGAYLRGVFAAALLHFRLCGYLVGLLFFLLRCLPGSSRRRSRRRVFGFALAAGLAWSVVVQMAVSDRWLLVEPDAGAGNWVATELFTTFAWTVDLVMVFVSIWNAVA